MVLASPALSPRLRVPRRIPALAGLGTVALLALTGCVANDSPSDGALSVESSAEACTVSAPQAPSGTVTFSVANTGSEVTEFYLLAEDRLRVISEVENIGPGLTRDLVVQVPAGSYWTACKPGMVGEGIQAAFTVTDSGAPIGPTGAVAEQLAQAEDSYVAYVKDQVSSLVAGTAAFAEAYAAGDDDTARSLYASTRVHWERVEPVAESFGDLDPLLDAREADLAEGETWSGWHYIEKDLWAPAPAQNDGQDYVPLTPTEREQAAADLVTVTDRLSAAVTDENFTFAAFQISNGAKELLDEVVTGKITGEEEIWSHTDLWDLAANVDGASVALGVLREVATANDPELVSELDDRFAALATLLAEHGSYETGFTSYEDLSADQITGLAAAVDAVGEPLSRLTATITSAG